MYQCRHKRGSGQLFIELEQGQALSRVDIREEFPSRNRSLPGKCGGRAFPGREAASFNIRNTGGVGKMVGVTVMAQTD